MNSPSSTNQMWILNNTYKDLLNNINSRSVQKHYLSKHFFGLYSTIPCATHIIEIIHNAF